MTVSDQKAQSAHNPLGAALFYLLNIVLLPVTVAGYILWIVKAFGAGRASGASSTAQGPLSARWFQHHLGTRPDEPASRMMLALPGTSHTAFYMIAGPSLLTYRLTGYVPKAFRYPFEGDISVQVEASARQTFFDSVVNQHLNDMSQFVILGAGFDTRAFRLPKNERVRWFEIDTPKTQVLKREMLNTTGIDATGVTFVAADFLTQDWFSRLVVEGFDINKPAVFLWEGVMMYLNRPAVESTFRKIAGAAPGSLIAFDYLTTDVLESQALYMRYARAATKAAGEPLTFGIDSTPPVSERLAELLQSCGLALAQHRTLGEETEKSRAWGGFATAMVK
jgi:methyltransferase (TIGR00027 family)